METNDPLSTPEPQDPPSRGEHTFSRRISCAPPAEAPRPAAPLRPGAHGTGQPPAGGNGR